ALVEGNVDTSSNTGSGSTSNNNNSGGSNNNSGGTSDNNSGGGTSNNTGGGTDTNTNDALAPTAVIDLMDASVPAGQAVHVNALKSTLKSGEWLGAKVEWDFGDSAGKYNTLTGFNAAHAYTNAGTYTIKLKLTNEKGKSRTVTTYVTITP